MFEKGSRVEYSYCKSGSGTSEGDGSLGTVVSSFVDISYICWDIGTYWRNLTPSIDRRSHYTRNLKKYEEFIPYDKDQQGDTEEDI